MLGAALGAHDECSLGHTDCCDREKVVHLPYGFRDNRKWVQKKHRN